MNVGGGPITVIKQRGDFAQPYVFHRPPVRCAEVHGSDIRTGTNHMKELPASREDPHYGAARVDERDVRDSIRHNAIYPGDRPRSARGKHCEYQCRLLT